MISKLVGLLLRVETWLVLALIYTSVLIWFHRLRSAQTIVLVTVLGLMVIGMFNPGAALLRPLEAHYAVPATLPRVDGIIVLGGAELAEETQAWGVPQVNEAGDRLLTGLALAKRFAQAQLLFSGGHGTLRHMDGGIMSGAEVAGALFAAHGIDDSRIILEGRSRNTAENAQFSHALVDPADDAQWVLVTSAFHMRRAMRSFEAAGWPTPIPYPVDHRSDDMGLFKGWDLPEHMLSLNTAIKEYVGLWVYAATGR